MNTRSFRKHQAIIIFAPVFLFLFLYCSWLFLFAGYFFISPSRNEPSRQALLKIREKIKVGDSYEDVLQTYWATDTLTLGLSIISESSDEWVIRMRPEFLETDWRLFIFFQNGKVIRHQVLTADGPPPSNLPKMLE